MCHTAPCVGLRVWCCNDILLSDRFAIDLDDNRIGIVDALLVQNEACQAIKQPTALPSERYIRAILLRSDFDRPERLADKVFNVPMSIDNKPKRWKLAWACTSSQDSRRQSPSIIHAQHQKPSSNTCAISRVAQYTVADDLLAQVVEFLLISKTQIPSQYRSNT
jgi:hypothetical protein